MEPHKTCASCSVSIPKGTMCGKCFSICKKYYRPCAVCKVKDIPPEKEDDVIHCSKCIPSGSWKCTKCPNPVDAEWKKTCTPCWLKDNVKVGTGFCESCNKKVDDGKPKCLDCWKASVHKSNTKCGTCKGDTGTTWKKVCDHCYAAQRRIRK